MASMSFVKLILTAMKYLQQENYAASQKLMDVLLENRFLEVQEMGVPPRLLKGHYKKGELYYFRRNGECRIGFLKDGRVHVLNGPFSRWQLFDAFSSEYLRVLLAFCCLHTEEQEFFRKAMSGISNEYNVVNQLPKYHSEWKSLFLSHLRMFREESEIAA